ncbi:MAG: ring-cleaving dioxygenase [Gemmatimonadota bacterium]|nr:ring-cleaving dioxygenase [Gemmatimonadota bacterium]
MPRTAGIHHVTSVAGSAQGNVEFYAGRLRLRLVKRTVNFDDPRTWHLYYGDRTGSPGTLITFFPWQRLPPGRPGAGEVAVTSYAVPRGVLAEWREALEIEDEPSERFGRPVVEFRDTDGGRLELVEVDVGDGGSEVDEESGTGDGIRGFHGVTLSVARPEPTARLLADILGYEALGEEEGRLRLAAAGDGAARFVDVLAAPDAERARLGAGSVHHVAFRARDDEEQAAFREELLVAGVDVTPVRDRQYFRSIYFREPGGALFEIATDPPGMLIDEPVETLGSELRLPPWYEPDRARIEAALPPITGPGGRGEGPAGS